MLCKIEASPDSMWRGNILWQSNKNMSWARFENARTQQYKTYASYEKTRLPGCGVQGLNRKKYTFFDKCQVEVTLEMNQATAIGTGDPDSTCEFFIFISSNRFFSASNIAR